MDALESQTLASELEADGAVVVAAIDLAGRRCAEGTPSGHDSAAHHVSRAYNVIEQMGLRRCSLTNCASRSRSYARSVMCSSTRTT